MDYPCIWCGESYVKHESDRPADAPVPKMGCLGLRSHFTPRVEKAKIEVKCGCIDELKHSAKKVWIIKRTDGGFSKAEMFFSPETAQKHVKKWTKFYEDHEHIMQGRTWEREHYLVECEIVEKIILK